MPDFSAGWARTTLDCCIAAVEAGTSVNSEDRRRTYGEAAVLKTSAVSGGRFYPNRHKAVVAEDLPRVSCPVKGGTIILSRMNTKELVGESGYVREDDHELFLPDRLWALTPRPDTDGRWLSQLLASPGMRDVLGSRATGTSGSMKNISQPVLLGTPVLKSPMVEQRRIAAVLDAWDDAALAAEQLTALADRKQAALLQYLFTNDGTTTGTLAEYFIERKEWGRSGLPVYSVTLEGGLTPREQLDRRTESALADDAHALVERGDLAYNMMRMWQGALGIADQPCLVSPAYVVMQPLPSVDIRFAAAWMKSPRGLDRLWAYSHGITEDRLRLYADDFLAIPVSFPPLDRQRAIGQAHETTAQATREARALAETLRRQKRGLMQKLLTGEWRVPAIGNAFVPGGPAADRLEVAE